MQFFIPVVYFIFHLLHKVARIMVLTKSFGIPFFLISTVTTSSMNLNNLIKVAFVVASFETLNTKNWVILKNTIVTFKGFCFSSQNFGTDIALCWILFKRELTQFIFLEISVFLFVLFDIRINWLSWLTEMDSNKLSQLIESFFRLVDCWILKVSLRLQRMHLTKQNRYRVKFLIFDILLL